MDNNIKNPKVTVMMPVYNGERYISDAIKSILSQTLRDFELLIMNDGSTDNTLRVVRSFNDPRIRIIENEKNLGTILTRNRGLKECRGEYVAMLDSDDLAYPERLQKQVDFLDKNPDFGLVGTWVDLMDSEGKKIDASWRGDTESEEVPIVLLFHNCFSFSSVMLRREAIPTEGFRDGFIPTEDYEIWTRIIKNWKADTLREVLTTYRIHEKSLSKTKHDLQQSLVNQIVRSQLKKIGVDPTENEMAIHRTNDTYRGVDVKKFIISREKWLLNLIQKNDNTGVYDKRVFRRVMGKMWLRTCKSNTSLGLWLWIYFWVSPLSRGIRFKDWRNIGKFFIKSSLKKDDR